MTAILMTPSQPPKFTKRGERPAVKGINVEIHCRLQELIDTQGLNRSSLSEQTGLTSGAIRGLCDNTTKRYDKDTLAVLCDFFGCGMGELFAVIPREEDDRD